MRAQWKGAETGSAMARLAPLALASSIARPTAARVPEIDHLAAAVVVGGLANLARRTQIAHRLRGDRGGLRKVETDDGGHRALAGRNGALHGVSANAQQPRGVLDAQRAGGGEGRIFAQRMAGDELRVARNVQPGFCFENAARREADRHQGGLRVGREGQFRLRPLEHQSGQVLPERTVHLGEYAPGRGVILRERLAHADRLRPLAGKHKSRLHHPPLWGAHRHALARAVKRTAEPVDEKRAARSDFRAARDRARFIAC